LPHLPQSTLLFLKHKQNSFLLNDNAAPTHFVAADAVADGVEGVVGDEVSGGQRERHFESLAETEVFAVCAVADERGREEGQKRHSG
jgi:hypothetical protein